MEEKEVSQVHSNTLPHETKKGTEEATRTPIKKKNSPFVIGGILLVVVLLILFGIYFWMKTSSVSTEPVAISSQVIKVGNSYWPGQFWKEIASEKGWFKEAGLNVELIDSNKDYYQSLQDTVDGKIDANDFPPFDFILYLGQGANLVAVINTDVSSGIDAVIVNSKITEPSMIKGKRVAVPKGTFGEYLLEVALERNGLKLTDVIEVDAKAEKTHEYLSDGRADAAVTYEPFLSEAIAKTGARRFFDTSEVQGMNSGVEVFNGDFVKNNPELVTKYVEVWNRTTTFIKENPDEAYEIIATHNNVKPQEVADLVKSDKILDLKDNKIAFTFAPGYTSLHGSLRELSRFMVENKLIDQELDSTQYLDGSFIKNIK